MGRNSHQAPDPTPIDTKEIRRAASVILRRSASDSRVFLARRSPDLHFFGGYYAFVGGGVGRDDDAMAVRLSKPELGASGGATGESADLAHVAFALAAARELFEELGLDLSSSPLTGAEGDTHRRSLLREEISFLDLPRNGGTVTPGRLRSVVRLLTPAYHPIRYDTQFYLLDWKEAGLPEPSIWPGELDDGAWRDPAEWLERWRHGELLIAPPVLFILRTAVAHGWEETITQLQQLSEELGGGRIHTIFYNPAAQLIPVRTPTIPPATHTNVYLVGTDPAYLVDPATPYPEEQERLESALDRSWAAGLLAERRLHAILLTHHHPDHLGAVQRLRKRYGTPVWAHRKTAEMLEDIVVDRFLEDGEVLFTPGHTAGHLCFFERRYGSLLAGDMVSTLSSILVRTSDGEMTEYMKSLERIATLPVQIVYPGHGPASPAGSSVLRAQLEHRRAREASILAAVRGGASDFDAIVEEVYRDVPQAMHGYALQSVESVCAKLALQEDIRLLGDRVEPVS
jgi:ribonuclease/clavin/mitogillin